MSYNIGSFSMHAHPAPTNQPCALCTWILQVMSKAMALEWVCLGGIRQASQGGRCLWGGH